MNKNCMIEIFSAGCPLCYDAVDLVKNIARADCEVHVLDMHVETVASRAKSLGIHSVPTILIDGKIADCCKGKGPDESILRAAGIA